MLQRVATSNTRTAVAVRLHAIGGGSNRCSTPCRSVQHLATQRSMLQHRVTRCNAGQPAAVGLARARWRTLARRCNVHHFEFDTVCDGAASQAQARLQRGCRIATQVATRVPHCNTHWLPTPKAVPQLVAPQHVMQHMLQPSRTCCNTAAHATATCHVADNKHNRRIGWAGVRSCGRRSCCTMARATHPSVHHATCHTPVQQATCHTPVQRATCLNAT
jgi:hypothetical protein